MKITYKLTKRCNTYLPHFVSKKVIFKRKKIDKWFTQKYPQERSYKILIETQWTDNEWWDWFIERDYTTLATRAENRNESNYKYLTTFKIPLDLDLFRGKRVGFEYGTSEREFLIMLASENNLI